MLVKNVIRILFADYKFCPYTNHNKLLICAGTFSITTTRIKVTIIISLCFNNVDYSSFFKYHSDSTRNPFRRFVARNRRSLITKRILRDRTKFGFFFFVVLRLKSRRLPRSAC